MSEFHYRPLLAERPDSPWPLKKVESGHGRREARLTRIFRLDDPAQLGMFGMHTIVQTKRQWEHLSGPNKGERTAVETSYHASTIEIDERLSRKNSSQITPCHYGWSWMRLQTESPCELTNLVASNKIRA